MTTLTLSDLVPSTNPRSDAEVGDDGLILTSGQGDLAGAVYTSTPIDIANDSSFSAQFSFSTAEVGDPEGLTFILHNDPAGVAALGDRAPGLGYQDFDYNRGAGDGSDFAITNALVIEFDTFENNAGQFEDVSGNSIEVALIDGNGDRILLDASGNPQTLADGQMDFTDFDFNNGEVHTAWIEYDGNTQILSIFLATGDSPAQPTEPVFTVDLSGVGINDLETVLGGQQAYVGFTAAGGGRNNNQTHTISAFDFESTPLDNVAPELSAVAEATPYLEQGDPVTIFSSVDVSDANGDSLVGAQVTLTNGQADELLAVDADLLGANGLSAVYDPLTGILSLTGTASAEIYGTVLESLTYASTSDTPPPSRTLSISVSDGELLSEVLSQDLTLIAVEDPAQVTVGDGLTVEVGTAATVGTAQFTATDPDTPASDLVYTVVNGPTSGQLEFTDEPGMGITSFTQADLEAGRVQYVSTDPEATRDSIEFALADGTEDGATVVLAITLTPASMTPAPVDPAPGNPVPVDPEPVAPAPVDPVPVAPAADTSELLDLRNFTGSVDINFTVSGDSAFDNQVVFYGVTDANGTLIDANGTALSPGDAGYVTAATQQAVYGPLNEDSGTITLTFEGGQLYAPLLVVNGTLDQLLDTDPTNDPDLFFPFIDLNTDGADHVASLGPNRLGFEDVFGGGDQDFNDLVIQGQISVVTTVDGSETLDLQAITGPVQVQFSVAGSSMFHNQVGFYSVDNTGGQITDEFGNLLQPGDEGYAEAAARQGLTNPRLSEGNENTVFTLEGGQIYVPFLIVDGTLEDLFDADPGNDPQLFFPYVGANTDGLDHVTQLNGNSLGFEDVFGGGDQDFNDLVLTMEVLI